MRAISNVTLASLVALALCYQAWTLWSTPANTSIAVHPSSESADLVSFTRALTRARSGQVGSTGHPRGRAKQVAIGSAFMYHGDVFWTAVDTLNRLLPSDNVQVYSSRPNYGLDTDILPQLGINPLGIYRDREGFLEGVSTGWGNGADGGADAVILGTCEVDMKKYSDDLFALWLARPDDRKFDLICIVHNGFDDKWMRDYSADWVRVGALRIMPISAHVKKFWHRKLALLADDPDRYHLGYDIVPVMEHIPLYPLDRLHLNSKGLGEDGGPTMGDEDLFFSVDGGVQVSTSGRKDGRILRDAVIQGNFQAARRAYGATFANLEAEIKADPAFWGYKISPSGVFVPISRDAFLLHLIGGVGSDLKRIMLPSLEHVVQIHSKLSYRDFYAFLGRVDVVLPAFTEQGNYMVAQASSTVAMAAQCGTALLTTSRIRNAYTYLTDATTIVRPQTMSEISAIKTLRAGRFDSPARPYSHKYERSKSVLEDETLSSALAEGQQANLALQVDAERMVAAGWVRGPEGFDTLQHSVRRHNEAVLKLFLWGPA